jgi:ABC-type methionine transport system permease subunit
LWAEGGLTGWLALLVTSAGIVFTGDIPLTILLILTGNLHISTAGLPGQILTVVLLRPTPLILLLMAIFYLWIYLRREPERA